MLVKCIERSMQYITVPSCFIANATQFKYVARPSLERPLLGFLSTHAGDAICQIHDDPRLDLILLEQFPCRHGWLSNSAGQELFTFANLPGTAAT
jgi:hypothetical protein